MKIKNTTKKIKQKQKIPKLATNKQLMILIKTIPSNGAKNLLANLEN